MLKSILFILIYSISLNAFDKVSNQIFTVKDAVNISADSYLPPQQFALKYRTKSNKLYSTTINGAKIYAIDNKKCTIIAFRGTKSSQDVKTDFDIKPALFLDISNTQVHRGFYDIANKSYKILHKILRKNKPIFITGHSLGGAISILFGGILQHNGYDDISIYSFGSPAIGNKKFVEAIKGLKHYRYLHKNDIVAKLDKDFVNTIKNTMMILKRFSDKQTDETNPFLNTLVNMVSNINYDYIYDDYKTIILTKKIDYKNNNKVPMILKFLISPVQYHSIEVYKKCILK